MHVFILSTCLVRKRLSNSTSNLRLNAKVSTSHYKNKIAEIGTCFLPIRVQVILIKLLINKLQSVQKVVDQMYHFGPKRFFNFVLDKKKKTEGMVVV